MLTQCTIGARALCVPKRARFRVSYALLPQIGDHSLWMNWTRSSAMRRVPRSSVMYRTSTR
jgi:hypothetical protein